MLPPNHVLVILSLLPLSLSVILSPSIGFQSPSPRRVHPEGSEARYAITRDGEGTEGSTRWMPRKRAASLKRGLVRPDVRLGGIELEVHSRDDHQTVGVNRRSTSNGSIINLGTSLNTYIIPVTIGSPPTTYPLQLDLGSSDILLASTLCGDSCPTSLGTSVNPYYDVTRTSDGFLDVNGNGTAWAAGFADGTQASGWVARETVMLGDAVVEEQVFGMINATNLTLSQQQISGILGLGFPRLSVLAHVLLGGSGSSASDPSASVSASSSMSAGAPNEQPASGSANSTASPYLSPLLESLVSTPNIPYPAFGLALAPPPANPSVSSTATSTLPASSATSRYSTQVGSLTLGGISSLYFPSNASSGQTQDDIEFWDVVPFGRAVASYNVTGNLTTSSTMNVASGHSAASRKRSNSTSSPSEVPMTIQELGGEEYLFWALELMNISMNGTDVGLNATYASHGLGSIALLDVGSNGIYGPQQDVEKIFALIDDAREVATGQWAVPCSTRMTMGFSFGERYIQLQPSDWMYAQVESSSFCLAWPVAVPPTGDGIDWHLGTPFLKKVYSVFIYGINGVQQPLIGFLPIPDSTQSSSSTTLNNATASSTTNNTQKSSSTDPYGATPTQIDALSLTTTIDTTLPNALLSDPSFTTPSYVFTASSALPPIGVLQSEGLAASSAYAITSVPVIQPKTSSAISPSSSDSGSNTVASNGASYSSAGMRCQVESSLSRLGVMSAVGYGLAWALGH